MGKKLSVSDASYNYMVASGEYSKDSKEYKQAKADFHDAVVRDYVSEYKSEHPFKGRILELKTRLSPSFKEKIFEKHSLKAKEKLS